MKQAAWVFALAGIALAACAHASSSSGGSTASSRRAPAPAYRSYPMSAFFNKHGPALSAAQRQWITHVLHSKNYGRYADLLRFAPVRGIKTPVVVFVAPAGDIDPDVRVSTPVLGEACNTYFDPYERGVFAAPGDAACARPTLKPVQ